MNNEMITMLNQSEVFGHEDSRLLFIGIRERKPLGL